MSFSNDDSKLTDTVGERRSVSVQASCGKRIEATKLAERYQFALVGDGDRAMTRFVLKFVNDKLSLFDLENPKCRPIWVPDSKMPRLSRKQLLGKAIGRQSKLVVDATAGWGSDAILMAAMGFTVLAIERCAAVSALLEDGIERNRNINQFFQLSHRYADAVSILDTLEGKPDTVYLDPMYPQGRKKSVRVSRKMTVLRTLAGEGSDFLGLFEQVMCCGAKKVVLKRPKYADLLYPEKVSTSLQGKMVRYDIYHP